MTYIIIGSSDPGTLLALMLVPQIIRNTILDSHSHKNPSRILAHWNSNLLCCYVGFSLLLHLHSKLFYFYSLMSLPAPKVCIINPIINFITSFTFLLKRFHEYFASHLWRLQNSPHLSVKLISTKRSMSLSDPLITLHLLIIVVY